MAVAAVVGPRPCFLPALESMYTFQGHCSSGRCGCGGPQDLVSSRRWRACTVGLETWSMFRLSQELRLIQKAVATAADSYGEPLQRLTPGAAGRTNCDRDTGWVFSVPKLVFSLPVVFPFPRLFFRFPWCFWFPGLGVSSSWIGVFPSRLLYWFFWFPLLVFSLPGVLPPRSVCFQFLDWCFPCPAPVLVFLVPRFGCFQSWTMCSLPGSCVGVPFHVFVCQLSFEFLATIAHRWI